MPREGKYSNFLIVRTATDAKPRRQQQGTFSHGVNNRTSTKAGGDNVGQGLRPASYFANSQNQYTSRDVPGYADIMGASLATNTVTVNGQTAYRHGEYFRQQLPIDNSSAQWTNITVAAAGQTSTTGHNGVS